jgi:hypothetical protein
LLSGDLPLTLLELGSLGGLVAAAWLLPSEKVDVKGSWSLKELAAFLCTKEGPWRLRFFDPCNGDFIISWDLSSKDGDWDFMKFPRDF